MGRYRAWRLEEVYQRSRILHWPRQQCYVGDDDESVSMTDCLFCKIVRGEIPAKKVFEDEHTLAFEDIQPRAPTHVLVIPKKHIRGLNEAAPEDAELIGRLNLVAAQIGRERGIAGASWLGRRGKTIRALEPARARTPAPPSTLTVCSY